MLPTGLHKQVNISIKGDNAARQPLCRKGVKEPGIGERCGQRIRHHLANVTLGSVRKLPSLADFSYKA